MKFKSIGHFFGWILLGFNGIFAALMILCAYSPYISPTLFPVLACSGLAFPIFFIANILWLFFWVIFHRRYSLLSLVSMFICYGAIRAYVPINLFQEAPPENALKILSYNVMGYNKSEPHTKELPNKILAYLSTSNADIICLQEAMFNKWGSNHLSKEIIEKEMSDYPYYLHTAGNGNAWECFSKYPILSEKKINYSSKGNGSIAYEIKVGKDTILLINNHLESNKLTTEEKTAYRDMIIDPEKQKFKNTSLQLLKKIAEAASVRAPQADTIAKIIKNSHHKYIIACGDFNDSPISYVHHTIGENLNDAFINSGNGIGISFNKNGFYFRIDHILTSKNIKTYKCTVDKSIKTSDHYPIWSFIRLD